MLLNESVHVNTEATQVVPIVGTLQSLNTSSNVVLDTDTCQLSHRRSPHRKHPQFIRDISEVRQQECLQRLSAAGDVERALPPGVRKYLGQQRSPLRLASIQRTGQELKHSVGEAGGEIS